MSQKAVATGVQGEGETVVQSMFGRLKSPQIITGILWLTAQRNELRISSKYSSSQVIQEVYTPLQIIHTYSEVHWSIKGLH